MSDDDAPIKLSATEQRLVQALREMPPGPLADRVAGLLEQLTALLRDPHCYELQADGAPCATPAGACADCQRVAAALGELRQRLLEIRSH
jgi:hypothetical protein